MQFRFGLKVSSVGSVKSTSRSRGKMILSEMIAVILALFLFSTVVGMSVFVEQYLFALVWTTARVKLKSFSTKTLK